MNNDSKEERDEEQNRERDEKQNKKRDEEQNRERDEKRNRERDEERNSEDDEEGNGERDEERNKERIAISRRVTGAESLVRLRGVCSSKKTLHDGAFGGTPLKRQYPGIVSSHTYTATGARPKEPVARYGGSEPYDTGRGGHVSTKAYQTSDRGHVSQERRRLLENDVMDPDIFTNTLIGAAEEAQPAEISNLIAIMDKQQLESSLQHMVMKWKELKESISAKTRPCRSSTSDSQLLRPATGTHTGATTTSPRRVNCLLPELPRGNKGGYITSGQTEAHPSTSTTYLRRPSKNTGQKKPTAKKWRQRLATTTKQGNRQQN